MCKSMGMLQNSTANNFKIKYTSRAQGIKASTKHKDFLGKKKKKAPRACRHYRPLVLDVP